MEWPQLDLLKSALALSEEPKAERAAKAFRLLVFGTKAGGEKVRAAFLPPFFKSIVGFLLVTDVARRNEPSIHFNEQRTAAVRQIDDDVLHA